MSKEKFQPTAEMIQAAETAFAAMAYVETIRPVVEGIQKKVLAENQYPVSDEVLKHCRAGVDLPNYIVHPKETYLMSKTDILDYHNKCKALEAAEGLYTDTPEQCPLLVAENMERKAKRYLVDAMEPVTKINSEQLMGSFNNYKKMVELTLKLMANFVESGTILESISC